MLNIRLDSVRPVSPSQQVLIVEYPKGVEGTDDSTGFLWFDEADMIGEYNPLMYPGDRTWYKTAEEAHKAAIAWSR